MATSKDQTKAVVIDFVWIVLRLFSCSLEFGRVRFSFFGKAGLTPDPIDGFVTGGLNDPGGRCIRDSGNRPLIDRRGKSFLRGFFGYLEVAKRSNEGGNNAPPVRMVNCIYSSICACQHVFRTACECGVSCDDKNFKPKCRSKPLSFDLLIEEVKSTCGSGWLI